MAATFFQGRRRLAALLVAWIFTLKVPLQYPQVLWKIRHLKFESQLKGRSWNSHVVKH